MGELSYDTVPYTSTSFAQTSPEALAAIARGCSLQTPDILPDFGKFDYTIAHGLQYLADAELYTVATRKLPADNALEERMLFSSFRNHTGLFKRRTSLPDLIFS